VAEENRTFNDESTEA
jgi:hypothetical protein